MKTYQAFLQTSIILLILGLNSYSIANAIRLQSGWGITLALGSMTALAYCIYLFKKLGRLETDEDCDNY